MEKNEKYRHVKDQWVKARMNAANVWSKDYQNTQQFYKSKIDKVETDALAINNVTKKMEEEENALIKELEMTRQNQFAMLN